MPLSGRSWGVPIPPPKNRGKGAFLNTVQLGGAEHFPAYREACTTAMS